MFWLVLFLIAMLAIFGGALASTYHSPLIGDDDMRAWLDGIRGGNTQAHVSRSVRVAPGGEFKPAD